MDLHLLSEIGLTPGEIKVYFALLENGKSKTGEICNNSGVHTSKVYLILDRLIKKGLVSYIKENKIRFFQASDPDQLLEYVRSQKRKLEDQETELKQIIPEILNKQKLSKFKQSASIYEGIKGVKSIFEIMLNDWKESDDYLVFTLGDEFQNKDINEFFKHHHLKRIEKNVHVKVLGLESQREFLLKSYKGIKNFEFRFTEYSLPAGLNIVGDKVVTLLIKPQLVAFDLNSKFLADQYREFFHKLWKIAKK